MFGEKNRNRDRNPMHTIDLGITDALERLSQQDGQAVPFGIKKPDVLSSRASELISETINLASQQVADAALEAVEQYYHEASSLKTRVNDWANELKKQSLLLASDIAKHHAGLRDLKDKLEKVMQQPDPMEEIYANQTPVNEFPDQ